MKELAAPFAMSGPAGSKHLRVLERGGLITRGRAARWRPHKLEPAPAEDGVKEGMSRSFDRLDEYLRTLA